MKSFLLFLQFVIVVDDENGDVEGNIVMAASLVSPRDIAFMVRYGSGIVSVGMKEEDLDRLKLPLMSPETEDEDSSAPTFTITVVNYSLIYPLPKQTYLSNGKGKENKKEKQKFLSPFSCVGCEGWDVYWSVSLRQGKDCSCFIIP